MVYLSLCFESLSITILRLMSSKSILKKTDIHSCQPFFFYVIRIFVACYILLVFIQHVIHWVFSFDYRLKCNNGWLLY